MLGKKILAEYYAKMIVQGQHKSQSNPRSTQLRHSIFR